MDLRRFFPFKGVGRKNLKAFSLAAMCNDTGEEMFAPYLPYFAKVFLGAGPLEYGLIESCAEAVNRILRIITGAISDRVGRKRPVVIGYILISSSRLLLIFTTVWQHLIPIRMLRQIGRSFRDPAREASITDSIEPALRGKAFGLLEAVDTIGSALGPIVGLVLLSLFSFGAIHLKGEFSSDSYKWLFLFAALPTLISSIIIIKGLEETHTPKDTDAGGVKIFFKGIRAYLDNKRLMVITAANCLLAIGAVTVGMLQFYVYTLPKGTIFIGGVCFVLYSISHFIAAYPGGILADRIGKKNALVVAMVLAIVSLGTLGIVPNALWAIVPFVLYGVFDSIWIASRRAIVADLSLSDSRAQTLGTFSFIYGLASMPAPFFFGALSGVFGFRCAFFVCALLTFCALIILWKGVR